MWFKIITLIIFLSASELICLETQTWIKSSYWYSGSEFPVPDINSALFTHLICAFAKINYSSYELFLSSSDEPYVSTFTDIVKKKNPSVTTLLSIWVGDEIGDENFTNFFAMINQSDHRKSFIESSIRTARLFGFQGLDLWCYVLTSTGTNMTNLGTLLDEWRAAIDAESRNSTKSTLTLIMTGHYVPEQDSISYPLDSIQRNLNWVHVKTYDYHLPSKENVTGAHAALYDPSSTVNSDYGIKEWIRRGVPASKLVLGLAYHGYAWTLVNPKDNQIGALARGRAITADGSMSYKYINWYMRSYGTTSVYNASYVVNYCTIGSFWIGFDDVEAIKTKISYAKEKGLLGYNAWQAPNDDNWVLSKAAQDTEKDQKRQQWLLIIMLSIIAIVIVPLGTIMCYSRKRELKSKVMRILATRNESQSPHLQVFSLASIKAATNNFSSEYKLGEGGFGPVYKGKLPDGQELAVKRLAKTSKQGLEEFKNEVTLTAKLQHVNLVKLLGFCTGREEKMLIYEYMPNKSLDFYLYDPIRKLLLDWEKRVHIIEGITQGLLYLQEYSRLTIVHRDLKASNILLDNEMKPKISDFGIARIFEKDENEANTGRIVGTYGYVPPEYVKKGLYSKKYDVYSFGVLLLQIISCKKNTCLHGLHDNLNLLEYAYELWKNGKGLEFMDPSLDDASSPCKLMRCLEVALLCVQEKWEDRPTMLEVFSMLKNETEFVPTPKRPAFSVNKDADEPKKITLQEDTCSINIATLSQVIPR